MKGTPLAQTLISILVTSGFISILILLVTKPVSISDAVLQILLIMIGNLSANFNTVVQYYMGSSSGSANKDRLLMKQAEPPADPPANG